MEAVARDMQHLLETGNFHKIMFAMRERAVDLGRRIKTEDGVSDAVAIIEQAYGRG